MIVRINFEKAKEVAHKIRRQKRDSEFAPHDSVISKQIPGKASKEAEVEREKIRKKFDDLQVKINRAKTIEEITEILSA